METTITEMCQVVHNYFVIGSHSGTFVINDGMLEAPFLKPGQYFCISNSFFNDGVYQYPAQGLRDESFTGDILVMDPPQDFIQLAAEIREWRERHEIPDDPARSPFTEEAFGKYGYKKRKHAINWISVFGSHLNTYRRLSW